MKVLVTGGLGYIGSHTCVELLEENHEVVVLDNLSNSKEEVKDKIKEITGKEVKFYFGDMINEELLDRIFTEEKIDAVIDFAAYKAVGESVQKPVEYYTNNISTVLVLLKEMKKHEVKKLVFSSSATVYGDPEHVPIKETDKTGGTTNPYGTSKLFVEQILKDLYKSDNSWDIAILRYFNPIGAHKSGLIGEEPNGIPANLMPYIAKVASGELECLSVFGNDYPTEKEQKGLYIYNLGTGTGYSVLDIINAFEKVNQVKVNYKITDRRPGDIAECFADSTKAKEELDWQATLSIEDMCRDAYNFIQNRKK